MKRALTAITVLILLLPAISFAGRPISDLKGLSVPTKYDGTLFTLEEIQAVIIDGANARGWSASLEKDGLITATIVVRGKHFAKLHIPFDERMFSLLYADSENLDYNAAKRTIHRNYNNWVLKLSRTINQKFTEQLAASQQQEWDQELLDAATPGPRGQGDIYSQLLKLGELRDKGILTEEEFQAEKRKLLDASE